jgi:hypothetical protein
MACAALATIPGTGAYALDLFRPATVAKNLVAPPDRFVGTLPVEFDAAALGAMSVGETASFALPNGHSYEAILDRIDHHDNGDISWVGHLVGASNDQLVMVTMGANGTYGTFTLPDGNWGVIPGTGHDWLFDADVSQLFVDRTAITDARIPPQSILPRSKSDAICPSAPSATLPTPQTNIDVLFVMAPDFVSAHGGAANASTRINDLITSINTYYTNSKIAITLRRAGSYQVNYASAASQDSINCNVSPVPDACDDKALDNVSGTDENGVYTGQVGVFANVPLLRNLYAADMVAFMRGPRAGGGISGIAWIGGYAQQAMAGSVNYMYALGGDSPGFTGTLMAHEMGHNMGNNHDPANAGDATPGFTTYAYGYTYCGATPSQPCPQTGGFNGTGSGGFGTIMSYWRPTLARFSNPADTCSSNGSPVVSCGGTIASASPAFSALTDETRTINCSRTPIAAMRDSTNATDCANPTQDTDGDGVPDCVEHALSMNAAAKDNDIFSATRNASLLFAMQQYRDFLARTADADGLNFWIDSLMAGTASRPQTIESFFNSAEFQGVIAPIARLYFAYFNRIPDYAGLQFWITQYKNGMSLDTISQNFAASPEFTSTYGALSNSQFVTLVYSNVLGRAPDGAGLSFWTGQLDTVARNRGQVMTGFSESAEYQGLSYNKVYVTMMYVGMLRRAPDTGGFNFWVSYLSTGSGQALINGFLGAAEYHNRFLP